MAAAAPGGNADKDEGGADDPRRRMSRAELVKRWEDVFDNVGAEKAMELLMMLLLRDARADHAQRSPKEQQEEEERRARVFEPWHPPPPGSSMPPPVVAPPRVERSVVLGLRAPPHLLHRPKQEKKTPAAAAADLGRSVKPAN